MKALSPEELDDVRDMIGHVNHILATVDPAHLAAHQNRVSLEREGKEIPNEAVRMALADIFRREGWIAETGQGENSGAWVIELTHQNNEKVVA